MPEIKVGDYVQIKHPYWPIVNGKYGYITGRSGETGWIVKLEHGGSSFGFYSFQLILIDEEAEARKVLGDGYFA